MIEHIDQKVLDRLQTALSTEMDGYGFYTEVAKRVSDAKGKNFFKHMASDELDHMKAVMAISDSVKAGRGWVGYNEAVGSDYTKGAKLPIFPERNAMLEKLGPKGSDIQALEVAIESERDAVKLYGDMLRDASGDVERAVLKKLVDMEQGHLDVLRWEKDSLMKAGFWADYMEFSVEKER